jgi:hypothetical protein
MPCCSKLQAYGTTKHLGGSGKFTGPPREADARDRVYGRMKYFDSILIVKTDVLYPLVLMIHHLFWMFYMQKSRIGQV